MIFRKNALLFYQSEIAYIITAVLCLTLIPTTGVGLCLLYMIPFIILILINPILHNEFIEINENGISCRKSDKQLWEYGWNSVAELRKSSRFLLPSIDVIVYNNHGESESYALPNQYFQYCGAAKKAIDQYYRQGEHKINGNHNNR